MLLRRHVESLEVVRVGGTGVDELVNLDGGKGAAGAGCAGVEVVDVLAPFGGAGAAVVLGVTDDEGGASAEKQLGGGLGDDAVLLVDVVDALEPGITAHEEVLGVEAEQAAGQRRGRHVIPGHVAVDALDAAAEAGKDDAGVVDEEAVVELPAERGFVEGGPLPGVVGAEGVVDAVDDAVAVFGTAVDDDFDALALDALGEELREDLCHGALIEVKAGGDDVDDAGGGGQRGVGNEAELLDGGLELGLVTEIANGNVAHGLRPRRAGDPVVMGGDKGESLTARNLAVDVGNPGALVGVAVAGDAPAGLERHGANGKDEVAVAHGLHAGEEELLADELVHVDAIGGRGKDGGPGGMMAVGAVCDGAGLVAVLV